MAGSCRQACGALRLIKPQLTPWLPGAFSAEVPLQQSQGKLRRACSFHPLTLIRAFIVSTNPFYTLGDGARGESRVKLYLSWHLERAVLCLVLVWADLESL